MMDWRDEGEVLNASEVAWGRPDGGFMWAPDCAFRNGVYYFYFPHPSGSGTNWNYTWKVGVATGLKPGGPFTPLTNYMAGVGAFSMIDPAVFIDDDGQAYFY
jgi:beta-xylosidase